MGAEFNFFLLHECHIKMVMESFYHGSIVIHASFVYSMPFMAFDFIVWLQNQLDFRLWKSIKYKLL